MIGALIFLQWQSFKNRVRSRFRRLKQPKYLIGGLVGGLYLGFVLFSQFFSVRQVSGAGIAASAPEAPLLSEMVGALILFTVILGAWLFPSDRAALTFTEAEIAFLFPAPVTRRSLIHFKLIRSQVAIFITTLVFTLVFSRRRPGALWIPAAGWWLMLSTINLHRLGSSFARTMLLDRGITNWQRRWAILGLAAVAGTGVLTWAWRNLPPLSPDALTDLAALGAYAKQLLTTGLLPWLLYPVRIVVQPYLARDAAAFALALGPALLLLALHYWWVVRSNVAFEEASVEASRKLAEKIAAVRREGSAAAGTTLKKALRAPFRLRPVGPPHTALLWKNLIGASRMLTPRMAFVILAVLISFLVPLASLGRGNSVVMVVGFAAAALCGYATFFGPQVLRQDFRADLAQADLLKLYPLRGWQTALGEVLAPALLLSAAQGCLLLVAVACLTQMPPDTIGRGMVLALGVSATVLLPVLNLTSLLIVNGVTLFFPAWTQFARGGPRGIEVMGQQMLLVLGQLVVLLLALVGPGLVFALLFFLLKSFAAAAFAVVVATVAATAILALEDALGVLLVGKVFERLDLSVEQTV